VRAGVAAGVAVRPAGAHAGLVAAAVAHRARAAVGGLVGEALLQVSGCVGEGRGLGAVVAAALSQHVLTSRLLPTADRDKQPVPTH
jgi:hypothetical protein